MGFVIYNTTHLLIKGISQASNNSILALNAIKNTIQHGLYHCCLLLLRNLLAVDSCSMQNEIQSQCIVNLRLATLEAKNIVEKCSSDTYKAEGLGVNVDDQEGHNVTTHAE